jgi:hypothetical protein
MKKNEELEELMSSSLLEIVELSSGEIVLRRVDDSDAPLVKIQFSDEAELFLGDAKGDVGRAMIGTGVQLVGRLYDQGTAQEDEVCETLH